MTAQLWRVDGDELQLDFHWGQSRAWALSQLHRWTFMVAGTQSGKTSFGPWWLWREIKERGQGDYLAVTSTFDLFKLKMLPEMRFVFERVLRLGRYWSGNRVIELRDPDTQRFWARKGDDPMWGRIILRSAQSKGGLESATAKAAWLDECGQDSFTLETWEAVQRRLSLSQGRALGTTTPYNQGWLKSDVLDPWKEGDSDYAVVQFPSYVNPLFPREEYERAKRKLPGWRFSMFYDGQLAKPEGLIYGMFDDSVGGELVEPFPIPLYWKRAVGVDFGGANTSIVWAAEQPGSGLWFVYDEWLGGGLTSREYAEKALGGLLGARSYVAYGGAQSEGQSRRDWAAGGFKLQSPPYSEVEAGITNVIGYIKEQRLKVFKTCKGVRDEIGSYRRILDSTGRPTLGIVDKRAYHRLDAIRYLLAGVSTPTRKTAKSMRAA